MDLIIVGIFTHLLSLLCSFIYFIFGCSICVCVTQAAPELLHSNY